MLALFETKALIGFVSEKFFGFDFSKKIRMLSKFKVFSHLFVTAVVSTVSLTLTFGFRFFLSEMSHMLCCSYSHELSG